MDPDRMPSDLDGDGYTTCDGDCDDNDPTLHPGDADGDGYTSCNGDCSDLDPFTFPGSAPLDSSVACMRDVDEDDFGDVNAPQGGLAGSDCDDTRASQNHLDVDGDGQSTCDGDCDDAEADVFWGAAAREEGCMRDLDGDGYGDPEAPQNGDAGTDCDDTDASLNQRDRDAYRNSRYRISTTRQYRFCCLC